MIIFLDTNVLVNHWGMSGPSFSKLQWYLQEMGSKLIIPKIVKEETFAKYRQNLEELIASLKKQIDNMKCLLITDINILLPDRDSLISTYQVLLDKRRTELPFEIVAYDDIPHKDIVKKAINKTKPFSEKKEAGYRDALIWATILKEITSNPEETYALISNDRKAFLQDINGAKDDKPNELHKDLQKDITDISQGGQIEINVYLSLRGFITHVVTPLLNRMDSPKKELIESGEFNQIVQILQRWITQNSEIVSQRLSDFGEQFFSALDLDNHDVTNLSIYSVDLEGRPAITGIFALTEDNYTINASCLLELSFDFWADSMTLMELSDDFRFSAPPPDFGEAGDWVEGSLLFPVQFDFTYDFTEKEVVDFELEIEDFYGYCSKCRYPERSDTSETCTHCGEPYF